MNKHVLYTQIVLIFFLMTSVCSIGKAQVATHTVCTEDKNMIIGETTLSQIEGNTEFWSEYLTNYASYTVDGKKLDEISNVLGNRKINIIAVIGTWCGDTKEQFPVLQKIFNNLNNSNISIRYIGVNRDKLAGETDVSSLEILFIPTFIFYENAQELGRIVETPEGTMEEHIIKIVNKE